MHTNVYGILIRDALNAGRELACTGQLACTVGGRSAYVLRQRAARSVSRRLCIVTMFTLSGPELHEYMTRIRVRGQTLPHLPPALSMLEELQLAHVRGIPFENLSLHHPIVSSA